MGHLIWTITDLANTIKKMQENKFDCIITFDGKRGIGKSTCAVKLASRFPQFKLTRDIIFSREDVKNELARRKGDVLLADEMINVTYNRDFFSEEQKKIIKILNMYRDSRNVLISCVPNFGDLDKQFRALVKIRINVVRRGLAVIHTQNQSYFSNDSWDMKINEKIESRWLRKRIHKPNYSKLTTYRGLLRFGDLGKKQRELYERIKEKKRNVIVEVGDENTDKVITLYDKMLERIKLGTFTKPMLLELCLVNGLKYVTVVSNLNNRLKNEGNPTLNNYLSLTPKGSVHNYSTGVKDGDNVAQKVYSV